MTRSGARQLRALREAEGNVRRFFWIALTVWTMLAILLAGWIYFHEREQALELAEKEARANINKVLAFRRWATRHGGIYVTPDERTPPSPFLAHLPDRDVMTTDGQKLTLMNPAFMMRQMTNEFEDEYGVKGSITGLKLLNPRNTPDPWERTVLEKYFQDPASTDEVRKVRTIDGEPYMRMMRPMFMTEGCVKCHGHLGFKTGDLRGGVSVSVPLSSYLQDADEVGRTTALSIAMLWLLVVIGIVHRTRERLSEIRAMDSAQQSLRESEKRFALTVEGSAAGMWDWFDIEGDKVWWSPQLYELLGVSPADLPHPSFAFFVERLHPDDVARTQEAVQRHIKHRAPFDLEYRIKVEQAGYRWFQGRGQAQWDETGKPVRMSGSLQDITKRKRSEEELRRSSDMQRTLKELLLMSLKDLTLHNILERFTSIVTELEWLSPLHRGAIFLFDEEAQELRLVHGRDLEGFNLDPRAQVQVHRGRCLCGRKLDKDSAILGTDNESQCSYFGASEQSGHCCVPIWSSTQSLLGVFVLATPAGVRQRQNVESFLMAAASVLAGLIEHKEIMEERGRLQGQLVQAQKMEAVGTLASGIAHDFNNLLLVISGNAQLLKLDSGSTNPEHLSQINVATRRAAELVRGLLTIGRKSKPQLGTVDLGHEIIQTTDLLRRTIPAMIDIEVEVPANLPTVVGDPSQIDQVLMNLGTNARDAMPDGGVLTFQVRRAHLDAKYCDTHLDAEPGEYLCVRISDTGGGIPADVLIHIFEPFFTTKEVGQGTGLGLAIAYGIVRGHSGHITCESVIGQGTTFELYFPVDTAEATSETSEASGAAVESMTGAETILIVDDEESVRDLMRSALELKGYRILTAHNGEKALTVWETRKEDIDLFILDLGMPGMGGQRCLEELRRLGATAPIVIVSGYFGGEPQHSIGADPAATIGKPFDLTEFAQTIRDVLDRAGKA